MRFQSAGFESMIFILVGLVFAAVGLVFAIIGIRQIVRGLASSNWRTAFGTIISSSVEINSKDGSQEVVSGSRYEYAADVRYEYEVGGEKYTGSEISFASASARDTRTAERLVHRYPEGKSVQVSYNPVKPEAAVLEPGVPKGAIFPLIIGLPVMVFGALFAFSGSEGSQSIFDSMDGDLFRILLPSIGIFVGGIVFIIGVMNLRKARASSRWPTTEGKVISTTILRDRSSSSNSSSMTSSSQYVYKPEVAFEYHVAGERYLSNTVSFGDYASSNISHAEGVIAKYSEGTEVKVYYNQEHPEEAVLDTTQGCGVWLMAIIGFFFLVLSTILFLAFNFFRI